MRVRAHLRVCAHVRVHGCVCGRLMWMGKCACTCASALSIVHVHCVRGAVTIRGATSPQNGGQGGSCAGHVHVAQDEAGRARRAQVVGGAVYWAG